MRRFVLHPWFIVSAVAAGLGAPLPASAPITPAAREIVDRYVEATGGREALEAERALHLKARVASARLRGTIEGWYQVPDRFVTDLALGDVRVRSGFDGEVGWRTDLASKGVVRLEGAELDRLRAGAWFENEMWAREGQGGGEIVHRSPSYRAGREYRSIEVRPPAGPARRLWFDAGTGLLCRVVEQAERGGEDVWLDEWRPLAGRLRPTIQGAADILKSARGQTVIAENERATLDSAWSNPPLDARRFEAPGDGRDSVKWMRRAGLARVGFRYGTRHVWIRASINGAPPADFLLDTGASLTVVDRVYASRIGLAEKGRFGVQGMGGDAAAAFARVRSLAVVGAGGDGVAVRDLRVGIMDLADRHEPTLWRRMNGLIGADVLSRFVVEIDYDRRLVTFHDPASFDGADAGSPIEMRLTNGVPVIRATLDSTCAGDFLVDVGNGFGLNVHGSLVRSCSMLQSVRGRRQVKIHAGGVGDAFASWLCRLDRVAVGPFEWTEPIAGLSLSTRGMVGSAEIAGNIGNGVLERFRVTLDYPGRRLFLRPGGRFAERDRYSRTGLMLARLPERVAVAGIVSGSAAERAGLKVDDEVTAIDGRAIRSFTPEELDDVLHDGAVGSEHTIELVRAGRPLSVAVTLRDAI